MGGFRGPGAVPRLAVGDLPGDPAGSSPPVWYNAPMPEGYYLDTMGCQMNERDSETIAGVLESLGFARAQRPEEARVVVLNTCAVRAKPEHKVFSRLGDLGRLKRRRPELIVVVAGCVAQVEGELIRQRAPFVDLVVGPRNLSGLAEAVSRLAAPGSVRAATLTDAAEVIPEGLVFRREERVGAFVNISYGCDNFCAYCVVPYARGREQSRAPAAVLAEVRQAVAAGHREVTLLGQNVNSYRGRAEAEMAVGVDFPALLALVDAVPGLLRLRFTTAHPKDCSPALLAAMRELPTVCAHLHLPIQAGDDEVLARMGRGYTYAHYRSLAEAARDRVPGLAVTTDVMVGFPGETEEQFQRTLRAFEELRFDQAFMFKYSDRPGTRAAEFCDKVPEEVKQDRHLRLVALQNRIGREINRAQVGGELEVLVEGRDPKSPHKWRGRTRGNKLVVFAGVSSQASGVSSDLTGKLVRVRAEEAYLWGFVGTAISDGAG